MANALLQFLAEGESPQLVATCFRSAILQRTLISTRGKQPVGSASTGSFLWSVGVMGVTAALIKAKIAHAKQVSAEHWLGAAGLSSESSNLAVSLDYALSKQPNWLLDMFGSDSQGIPLVKRLFLRVNPERKRVGATLVAVNPAFLSPKDIEIDVDGEPIEGVAKLSDLLRSIGYVESDKRADLVIRRQVWEGGGPDISAES